MAKEQRFFDLQVNGYAGVDFNRDDLSLEDLHRACEKLAADGVAGALATVITESLDKMAERLARIARLREEDPVISRVIYGLHIEGPFIDPSDGFRGAHPVDAVRPAEVGAMKKLLEAGAGLVRLVTLAPEHDEGLKVTRMLASQGVVVSAGHCNPDLEQLKAAIDAGLSMFTHLGNGCPKLLPRHENIIQRALSLSDRLWLCFIGDGVHVPYPALGNYLRAASISRCIIVTDCVAPAGLGPGRYTIGRWELDVGEDMVVRAPGEAHLVGSGATMRYCYRNLLERMGLSRRQAVSLTRLNPQRALGVGDAVGAR